MMNYLKYIGLSAGICLCAGCSDFLEEYSQDTYYVQSYEDLDEVLAGDCYLQITRSNNAATTSNIGYFLPFLADEIEEQNSGFIDEYASSHVVYDVKEKVFGAYTWQQRIGMNDTYAGYIEENGTWKEVYRLINVANNVLESAEDVPQETETERMGVTRVRGEAHFLRGTYYFWLANLYGKAYNPATAATDPAVPIKLVAKVEDKEFQRNSVQEVYAQVLDDLLEAERCLSQTGAAANIYQADSTAVQLLLSRVYLYMQNWEQAARYADKVLAVRSNLRDMNGTTMAEGFLSKASKEILFSMGGNDVPCNLAYGYQGFRVARDLYNAYDDDDLRKSQWWWTRGTFIGYTKLAYGAAYEAGSYAPENDDFYFYAYEAGWEGQNSPVSDKFLFRTAEAYLNKAEAEAYQGNEREARTALNQLRQNRYAAGSDYEVTAAGEELVTAIREERRKELALEGHRWFDLRRYAVCSVSPESKRIVHNYTYYTGRGETEILYTHRFVLEENDAAYTLPIPNEVLQYNIGMQNNERPARGYTVVNTEN